MFWGFSSALDLYDEYLKAFKVPDKAGEEVPEGHPTELNVLICGGADSRHVIKTLAKRYTHNSQPKINFYLLDASVEIIARNMLLLGLALEPPESFSLVCKAHLFMDIYGNSLLRPTSHQYMAAKGRSLRQLICDEELRMQLAPIINVDALRYRERDGLEISFSFWQPRQTFDIKRYWEQRIRSSLGPRYDHREGVFDWDLNMTLKDREAQQICSQEYRYWRESGVAFVFPEYEHCKPNKTLAAGLIRNGSTYLNRGYLGDNQTGPYCGFGLRSSEERMHNSQHGENDYRATDITERNLLEFFHELQNQTPYEHDKSISRRYGCTQLLMTPLLIHNESEANEGHKNYNNPWISVPQVQIRYISPMEMVELQNGAYRWKDMFDIAFMAFNYYKFLSKEFFEALHDQSLFVLETKLLTVERKEHVKTFESNAKELLKQAGLKPCINYQAINAKNMYLKYKKTLGGGGDVEDEFPEEQNEEEPNKPEVCITEIEESPEVNQEKEEKKEQEKDCQNELLELKGEISIELEEKEPKKSVAYVTEIEDQQPEENQDGQQELKLEIEPKKKQNEFLEFQDEVTIKLKHDKQEIEAEEEEEVEERKELLIKEI